MMESWRRGGPSKPPLHRLRVTRPDPWLLVAVAALLAIGLVMVLDASYFFARERYGAPLHSFWKQVVALLVGTGLLLATSRVSVQGLERYAALVLWLCCGLLAAVLIVGVSRGGAQRWFGLGAFNIQPAEFAKIAVVIYLARSLSRNADQIQDFARGIVPNLAVVGVVAALIVLQPSFSAAAILFLVAGIMLFVGGARVWHLVGLVLVAVPIAFIEIWSTPYRWDRIMAVVDPFSDPLGKGFQLTQSLIAIGTGGWTGVGLGESRQKMFFLPEGHTDFIFSLLSEEAGIIGVAVVLGLFAMVGARGFRIAMRHPDPFASLLAFGLTLMIVLQALVNVAVAVGLLPTTGLALPFISYGGSALLSVMVQVGLLTALSRATG